MKILMLCFGGWSSSLFAKNLENALGQQGKDASVTTAPVEVGLGQFKDYDAILVAPQVRHMAKSVREKAAELGKPVVEVSMQEYGMGDVAAVAARLLSAFSDTN